MNHIDEHGLFKSASNYKECLNAIESEDKTPTERRIPIEEEKEQFALAMEQYNDDKTLTIENEKEQFALAITSLTNVALTSGSCFKEISDYAAPKDKRLAEACEKAREACDNVVAYIVGRAV